MKRPPISRFAGSVLVVSLLAFGGMASAALAQSPVPMATADNPAVGTWLLDTNSDDPSNPPAEAIFHADGTYLQADSNGVAVGAWESTGPDTGTLTIVARSVAQDGTDVGVTVRATFQVAPDAQSLTATYTVEYVGGDAPAGQMGPVSASGTRVVVEPMGSPVMPIPPPPSPCACASSPSASSAP